MAGAAEIGGTYGNYAQNCGVGGSSLVQCMDESYISTLVTTFTVHVDLSLVYVCNLTS